MAFSANWLTQHFPDLSDFSPLVPTGQKEVFLATHSTEGSVVLKLFKPGANAERIQREIQAPLKVNSARVPRVAELGTLALPTGDLVWLREQKIDGESLKDRLKTSGQLSIHQVMRIGLHVMEVLAASQAAKVVHRDIKPGNLIIAPDGSTWVIDFGLARYLELESVTDSNALFAPCTPGYAPVEQFRNRKREVDSRADLFALGVTLYECVIGANPYLVGAKTQKEVFERVEKIQLPRIAKPGVPNDLVEIVEAMTRRRAEHRLPDAAAAFSWMSEIASRNGVV